MILFCKVPPPIAVPIFYILVTVVTISKMFFSTVLGTLVLAIGLYFLAPHVGLGNPFSLSQLISWLDSLAADYKIAVFSSLLTITGFVIAFHTATVNWRSQLQAQVKSHAAGEIEEFFAHVARNITDANIYVESLVELVDKIQKSKNIQELEFDLSWVVERAQLFIGTRNQLSQALVEVHRMRGRNYSVLSGGWGLEETFEKAAEAFDKIGSTMWINVPIIQLNHPDRFQHFINFVNVSDCKRFLDACEKYQDPITMLAGSIKGYLLSPIIGFTFPMYCGLLANRKGFSKAVSILYRNMNDNN